MAKELEAEVAITPKIQEHGFNWAMYILIQANITMRFLHMKRLLF